MRPCSIDSGRSCSETVARLSCDHESMGSYYSGMRQALPKWENMALAYGGAFMRCSRRLGKRFLHQAGLLCLAITFRYISNYLCRIGMFQQASERREPPSLCLQLSRRLNGASELCCASMAESPGHGSKGWRPAGEICIKAPSPALTQSHCR